MSTATTTTTCPSWSWCKVDHTREPADYHVGCVTLGPVAEALPGDLPGDLLGGGRTIDLAGPHGAGPSSLVNGAEASVALDAAATARLAEVLNELLTG